MFWGAMDQRNPKSISSLKTFLGDLIEDESELSLELLTKFDLSRASKEQRKPKSDKASDSSAEPDILSDYAEKALEIVEDFIDLRKLEKCSDIIACKTRSILVGASLGDFLLSRNCSSFNKMENNICS